MHDMAENATQTSPRMSYHADFGRFSSNSVGISRGSQKIDALGTRPFEWGVADP